MKMITAMIQPFMLNKVVSALEAIENFPGMTATDARGFGRKKSLYEEHSLNVDDFHPKTHIEIVAPELMVEEIVQAIVRHAHTGNNGDGKVFVWAVESAVRIQTGEKNDEAV